MARQNATALTFRLLLLGLLAAPGGCALFGGDVPCEGDENCPAAQHCGAEKVCVDGPRSDAGVTVDAGSGSDAGPGSDAAESDAGGSTDAGNSFSCATPPCSPMPDSQTVFCRTGYGGEASCPETGQAYFGQDGNVRQQLPRYSQPTSGVVLDELTGLLWEQVDSFSDRNWSAALGYCEDLSLGGHDDWRMPGYLEMITLLDLGRGYPEASLDSSFFPAPSRNWFWSSSDGGGNGFYWVVDFWGFTQPPIQVNSVSTSIQGSVRCVRGTPLVHGDLQFSAGTWSDRRTGLVWQANPTVEQTWDEALVYCNDLALAGSEAWRLPSIKELETLVDRDTDASVYTFEALRTETGLNTYWSSTPYVVGDGAWALMFNSGRTVDRPPSGDYFTRCVHGP